MSRLLHPRFLMRIGMPGLLLGLLACAASNLFARPGAAGADGPRTVKQPEPIRKGDVRSGKDVFRFETFGSEGFWTDAARLPQGIIDAKLTPIQALHAGVQVDI